MTKKIDIIHAMSMNRHERRRLGKLNKTKIPGITKPKIGHETNTIQNKIHTHEENAIIERKLIEDILKENEEKF